MPGLLASASQCNTNTMEVHMSETAAPTLDEAVIEEVPAVELQEYALMIDIPWD
ncbi:hypothetical protein GCM10010470_36500 [Saccharopolyspora taberi]|uniref:Uncharacterized protein n=1 Tax=Saccharopolyspora taberi TaxID=60895 RepID=A0ABN3VFK6_9PSEU